MKQLLILITSLLLLPVTASAHHGTNGQFDATKTFNLSGVVSDVAFVNPHAYVYLDVENDNGDVETWNCELRAATIMRRSGWTKEMFTNGTKVEIAAVAARADPLGCYVEAISFNGGPAFERYAQIEENQMQAITSKTLVTAWGVPDISGDWAAEQRLVGAISGPDAMGMGPMGGMGGMGGAGGVELTDAGTAALARLTAEEGDNVTGRLDCQPRDFFNDWVFDQHPNRVVQEEDKVTLMYGFMDTLRTIHLDITEHPADIEPSFAGHSIGQWEDGVLVVETVGFTEGAQRGNVHGTSYKTIERFSLNTDDADNPVLVRSYEATDSAYWKDGGKTTGEQSLNLSDLPHELYGCDDRSVE